MIEFSITIPGGAELACVRIENLETTLDPSIGDYSVQIALDTVDGVALYQRSIFNFPRKEINVLGLLKAALDSLTEKELHLDRDPDDRTSRHSSDLAGRLSRAFR